MSVTIDDGPSPTTLSASSARALGAYYTPSIAAEVLVAWALRTHGDRILEPSMGDGSLLDAVRLAADRRGFDPEIWGVELAHDTFAATLERGALTLDRATRGDFMEVPPFPVDAVIANPPYVRLRHLDDDAAARARSVAGQVLDEPMDPSGSLWMPFVLHASRFLVDGGRLAFVVPFDLTYVRYARPLWRHLADHFGGLRVVRVHERMFPEILQEVVLLFADQRGGSTDHVTFETHHTLTGLGLGVPATTARLSIDRVLAGERVFMEALLPDGTIDVLDRRLVGRLRPAREAVTFNIGYVCGDKSFFHPSDRTVREFDIAPTSLRGAMTSSRQMTGVGLRSSAIAESRLDNLFLPPSDASQQTAGEGAYIDAGNESGVSERYKCRIRDPWFVTPGVKVPDVVLPVFTERPLMVVNDGGYVASNSLLCGYLRDASAAQLIGSWYTSLTLLQLELEVHALGGGVMVLVPREAGNVRLPIMSDVAGDHLDELDRRLRSSDPASAFVLGDDVVLRGQLGLTHDDVRALEAGAAALAFWRTANRSSAKNGS